MCIISNTSKPYFDKMILIERKLNLYTECTKTVYGLMRNKIRQNDF